MITVQHQYHGGYSQVTRVISNTYRGYTASIRYNEDDSVYIGSVEEISESFRGRTVDEALKRFHAVVDRHIAFGG